MLKVERSIFRRVLAEIASHCPSLSQIERAAQRRWRRHRGQLLQPVQTSQLLLLPP
jgi:hypothetical protein